MQHDIATHQTVAAGPRRHLARFAAIIAGMKALLRACLLLLAAPVAHAGENGYEDRRNDRQMTDVLRAVELRLESGAIFRPRLLTVIDIAEPASVAIPNPVPVRDEQRVNLRGLPVIGGLFQPTASGDFKGATLVGAAWRAGDMLVIGADPTQTSMALIDGVRTVVIANRDLSYQVPVDFVAAGAPYLGDLRGAGALFRIGDVHRLGESFLVLIAPTIVDISD